MNIVSWNVTNACNMYCAHCYRDAGCKAEDELSTADAKKLLTEIKRAGFQIMIFSGGEPLSQREFLDCMIDLCHGQGIQVAVETSMVYYDEAIFRKLDLIMADLKIWDDETHRRYCGVPAVPIREHFARAAALGVPMIARTPVIPGVDQGIDRIAAFLRPLENVKKYELLPYHALGDAKRLAMGLPEAPFTVPTPERMKELNQYAFVR